MKNDLRVLREGVTLACDVVGSGDPPLLLVHGWGTDRSLWGPLRDRACKSHQVLSVDLRGFGQSDAPAQDYTIAGHSDDLAFLVDHLGLQRPVVIGHSMGGLVALDFAGRHADRARAAVILEAMVAAAPPVLAGLFPMLEQVRSESWRDYVVRLMNHLTGPGFDPQLRAQLAASAASSPQPVLVSALEGIIAFDTVAAAAQVQCPLLYVGTDVTYADLPRWRTLCPQLISEQLPGCGHYFPLEVPDQLAALVARFVQTNVARQP
jgi:pimeloyl-ACP methyl ester carboxylesterase